VLLLASGASDLFSTWSEYEGLVELSLKGSKFPEVLLRSASEVLGGVWACQCAKNVGDKISPERERKALKWSTDTDKRL